MNGGRPRTPLAVPATHYQNSSYKPRKHLGCSHFFHKNPV